MTGIPPKSMRIHIATVAILVFAVACGRDIATSPDGPGSGSRVPVPDPTPTILALNVSPGNVMLEPGGSVSISASKVMSDGRRTPVTARWTSSNSGIVTVSESGVAVGVGPGQATITAFADGVAASAIVVVMSPTAVGASDALVVFSFSMTEFQYSTAPGRWFYAPQLRVAAAPGRRVTLVQLSFSIPGLAGPIPPFGCSANLSPDDSADLNGEVYGDWVFTIEGSGRAATAEQATAVITFIDDAGTIAKQTVKGPIVSGSLPSYGSGRSGACFRGYGSGG